jgi:hypothetical protein
MKAKPLDSYEGSIVQGSKLHMKFDFCKSDFYKIFLNICLLQNQVENFKKNVFKIFVYAFHNCKTRNIKKVV